MEAIAVIPTPPPPSPAGGQTQTNKSGEDTSFAPVLSHAVAGRNRNNGHNTEKSSSKAALVHPGKKPERKSAQRSATNEKFAAKDNHIERQPSSPDGHNALSPLEDPMAEKPSASTTPKADPPSGTAATDQTIDPTVLLPVGASDLFRLPKTTPKVDPPSGTVATDQTIDPTVLLPVGASDLFRLPKDPSLSTLEKTVATAADPLVSGKQASMNVLQNLADSKNDNFADKQLSHLSLNDSLQTTAGQNTQPVAGSKDGLPPTAGQDQSSAFSNNIKNINQNASIEQQLGNILTANGATVVQPPSQNQPNRLDSLSAPLFALAPQQAPKSITAPDISASGTLAASLPKTGITEGRNAVKPAFKLENDPGTFFTKADTQDIKDSPKVEEKAPAPQTTDQSSQSTLLDSRLTTDGTGNNQQIGQFSFDSALLQNLQTEQHTAATAATTGMHYQSSSSFVQENALINQVLQNFQINSNSPASKLVIKLSPEELGDLKIDIQLKNGAIKANILTQTEQVQQVIEKYIPKLKTFMEQQGLTVEDIRVTITSDKADGHDLFQKEFTENQGFSSPGKSAKSTSFADLAFEKAFSQPSDNASGVNVTV